MPVQADPQQRRAYRRLVARYTPRPRVAMNAVLAFVVGGALCATAQVATNFFLRRGLRPETAGALTAVSAAFAGAALTALGLYDEIVRVGGMGGSLPVTGFANSMAAPAMEYRREGWVLGVGARMFSVAGPVIVYGLLAAVLVGAVYAVLRLPLPRGAR
jgi:stage V sporulation protein AC